MTPLEQKITDLIQPAMAEMALVVVQVRHTRSTLEILLEQADSDKGATLEQCARAAREIGALLDVEDVVPGAYKLEVGSPGLERPLVTEADYQRFTGRQASVKGMEGRIKGKLLGLDEGNVQLEEDAGVVTAIPLADVQEAHLLTDNDELRRILNSKTF